MITSANEMLKALKGSTPKFTGVILYEGPSAIDGGPIVVIANRIAHASGNEKTGAMVQTFIIRRDMRPLEALSTGLDQSICGDCIHRPVNGGTCYVNVGRSVESVFGAYQRGRYARPGVDYDASILPDLFDGTLFRLGTYGDPAAAPFGIWANATAKVKARTGYTHQWKRKAFERLSRQSAWRPSIRLATWPYPAPWAGARFVSGPRIAKQWRERLFARLPRKQARKLIVLLARHAAGSLPRLALIL